MLLRRFITCVAVCLLAVPLFADAPGVYAITGGTVHPVSGPAIPNGTVIIRDGLIESVGANVAVPPDAQVIDAKGKHVYPGLIDAQTSVGFPAASAAPRGRRGGGPRPQTQTETLPETSPAFLAVREAKISDDDTKALRGAGVTTILTAPAFGIFNGQAVIVDLGDGTMDARVIRAGATQQISFLPRPAWTFPDSLMGVIADIRQTMLDAQWYQSAHAIYDKNPSGFKRPEENASLAALEPVLRRDVPVVFIANSELMMRRALRIAHEFNLRPILSGGQEAYRMPGDLKDVPVLVSVNWPKPPASKDDRDEQPLRVIRERQMAPTSPAVLQKGGVAFALVSAGAKTADFLPGVRKAIENGLSDNDALRAVTLSPARILGVDRQLGSLDRGKIANVVITDKPIFEKKAKVTQVFIDGREAKLPAPDEAKRGGGAATSPVDGAWSVVVKSSEGDINFNVTFHVDDGNVTGTFSGDRGSGDVREATLDGSTLEFTLTARAKAETDSWVFHGTISGTTMQGTVSTTLGTFPFSGSKGR